MTRNTTLGVLLALVVTTGMLAAPVLATSSSISAEPDDANAQSTHTVRADVGAPLNDTSLTGLDVDYSSTGQNGDVADVGESDIEELYIDRAAGGQTDVSDDISGVGSSNNGETLNIRFNGDYNIFEGDHVVAVYSGVENPSAGEYEITFQVNPQSGGTQSADTLSISENSSATPTGTPSPTFAENDSDDNGTATPTPTTTATDTPAQTPDNATATETDAGMDGDATATEAGMSTAEETGTMAGDDGMDNETMAGNGSDGESNGDGAGFGLALAVAAILGAALLARR